MADFTHPHYSDEDVINVETKHEESDVNVRGLLVFLVVFVVFAIVTHLALWLLFKFFVNISKGATANAAISAVAPPPNSNVPDLPRLQPFPTKIENGQTNAPYTNTPVTDMEEMRSRQDAALANYAWADKGHGIVRIPIEDAKRMALANGTYKPATASVPVPVAIPATATAPGGLKRAATTAPQPAPATPQPGNPATTRPSATPHP